MKKLILGLSLMAIVFASCKKEDKDEPQTCTCPSTSVDLDSRVIGTWEKVVKKENVVKHYMVLKDGSFSYNLVEYTNGERQKYTNDEFFLIQLGLYSVDDNNLTITETNNNVQIDVEYTKTNDIAVSTWVKDIELNADNKFSLNNDGYNVSNLTKTSSKLWGRNQTKLYEINANDYSVINVIENYDYGYAYGSSMTYVDNKLILISNDNNLITVDPNNGDILDTIEITLSNYGITAICANDNKIWYFDRNADYNTGGTLTQIDLSGNILKTIDFTYNYISDIVFINNEMFIVNRDNEILSKFDITTEKFTKSYNFHYKTEGNYIYLDNGVSVVDGKFIIEYGSRANSVDVSVFN